MQMIKPVLMAAGAVGAAGGAMIVTQPYGGEESSAAIRASGDASSEICLKGDLVLFQDVKAKCFSRRELLALRDQPVVDMSGGAVELTMAHPSDMTVAPARCRTCRDYGEMSFDGWFAMSSRDMRREAFFTRACGALSALLDAQPTQASFFDDGSPQAQNVADLAAQLWFGERGGENEQWHVEKGDDMVWRISSEALTVQIHEIANADFDNDGVEEILAFTAGAPEGGSASFYNAGLLEKDSAEAALSFTPLSYGRSEAAGAGL